MQQRGSEGKGDKERGREREGELKTKGKREKIEDEKYIMKGGE
jgi:hypothetical protein